MPLTLMEPINTAYSIICEKYKISTYFNLD